MFCFSGERREGEGERGERERWGEGGREREREREKERWGERWGEGEREGEREEGEREGRERGAGERSDGAANALFSSLSLQR